MTKGEGPFSKTPPCCSFGQSHTESCQGSTCLGSLCGLTINHRSPVCSLPGLRHSRAGAVGLCGALVPAPHHGETPRQRSHPGAGFVLITGVSNTEGGKETAGCEHLICSYVAKRWISELLGDLLPKHLLCLQKLLASAAT